MLYGVATFCIFHENDSVFRDIVYNLSYVNAAPIKHKQMAPLVDPMYTVCATPVQQAFQYF